MNGTLEMPSKFILSLYFKIRGHTGSREGKLSG
jgi:hypothetical protein